MQTSHKLTVMMLALLVLALGFLISTRNVSAAAEGKITGTVKFEGTAPHMKGIDMSKDPYCVKQHQNNPAKMENVVVGSSGGLQNVVLYITEGLTGSAASAAPSEEP